MSASARNMQVLATVAGLAAVILAAASVTVGLLASVQAPTSQLPGVQMGRMFRWIWISAAFNLVIGSLAIGQIVLRRPLLTTRALARRSSVGGPKFAVFTVIWLLILAFSFASAVESIGVIRSKDASALVSSLAFGGLAIPLGTASIGLFVLSNMAFLRWWRELNAISSESSGSLGGEPEILAE